ncbi:MAG: hypothetical protein ABI847_18995, partial [Anaerolineales bacterium]
MTAPSKSPNAPKAAKAPNPTPPLVAKLAITAMGGLFLLLFIIVLFIIGYGKGFSTGTGLFGTRASLFADINLLAELLLLFGLTIGFGLALTH